VRTADVVTHQVAASGAFTLLWLVIALPLLGAAILLLGGRRTDRWGHLLGTALPSASFVLSVAVFFALLGRNASARFVDQHLYSWVPVGTFRVDVGLLADPLSMCFVLLITGVGSLIHV
jgi:NADH-quinone oxidoreductase subunit L